MLNKEGFAPFFHMFKMEFCRKLLTFKREFKKV
jgi:hypothetical protein